MPIYEYLCQSCGKKFEVLQKFSDEPLTTHPECGGKVEKLISVSALKFKGSGWYVNDYAKGSTGSGETRPHTKDSGHSDSGHSDSGKSDGGGAKAESKAETKAESKPAVSESKPVASSSPAASDSK